MLDGGSCLQNSAFLKGVHFTRGTIGKFYPMVRPADAGRRRQTGARRRATAAVVEAGGHGEGRGNPAQGDRATVQSGASPVRLDQPDSRGELPVPRGTEPVGGTAHRRPCEGAAVNSSTMKGAKALASEIDQRRCRTAKGMHRWVSGGFLLRSAEITGRKASANRSPAGAGFCDVHASGSVLAPPSDVTDRLTTVC